MLYKQIIRLEPKLASAYQKLAELYHRLGLLPDAVDNYMRAIEFYEEEGNKKQIKEIRAIIQSIEIKG